MKIITLFFTVCTVLIQSQLSASLHDSTREEWKKYQNGSLEIEEQIPGLIEELQQFSTKGEIQNPLFVNDTYSLVISTQYINHLEPIIKAYAEEHNPDFISRRYERPLANSLYRGSPHVIVISQAETAALKKLGVDVKEVVISKSFNFHVKELRSRLVIYTSFGWEKVMKNYELIIESPDLDALRESLNLPKQTYRVVLLFQTLGTLNGE